MTIAISEGGKQSAVEALQAKGYTAECLPDGFQICNTKLKLVEPEKGLSHMKCTTPMGGINLPFEPALVDAILCLEAATAFVDKIKAESPAYLRIMEMGPTAEQTAVLLGLTAMYFINDELPESDDVWFEEGCVLFSKFPVSYSGGNWTCRGKVFYDLWSLLSITRPVRRRDDDGPLMWRECIKGKSRELTRLCAMDVSYGYRLKNNNFPLDRKKYLNIKGAKARKHVH